MRYSIPSDPSHSVFRPYDIRGPVGPNLLSEDLCYAIGLAVGSESMELGHAEIVTARDGRLSSPELYAAFLTGLSKTGIQIIDIGIATSPMLYFARVHLNLLSAAVLTASHSPKHYNGLKLIINNDTLLDEKIQNIFIRIKEKNLKQTDHILPIKKYDIRQAYIEAICSRYALSNKPKLVVDCGNGTGGVIASQLFTALGCEVIPLFTEVDGNFPNHHPDPVDYQNLVDLQRAVVAHKAECGFAFDGDADRIGVVNKDGEIIVTDRILMLFAEAVLSKYTEKKSIVFDVKCSDYLFHHIKACGGEPVIWTTGHSRIKKKMREVAAPMAAEMSAHIFFQDEWIGCDDGMLAGARLLYLAQQSGLSFSSLIEQYQVGCLSPEIRLPTSDETKHLVIEQVRKMLNDPKITNICEVDGLRLSFQNGWGLVRASLTEPSITMRFEGSTQETLSEIQDKMTSWVNTALNQVGKIK